MTALADVLALEVRVPLFVAVLWVLVVIGAGLGFGRWSARAEDARRFARIAESAERMEP